MLARVTCKYAIDVSEGMIAHGGVLFLFAGKSRISPMRGSMSYYHDDHAEEMEDDYDYDMDDPVDDIVDEHQDRGFMDFDSDDDNYAHSVCFLFFLLLPAAWVNSLKKICECFLLTD
jgi:hypothetical protein